MERLPHTAPRADRTTAHSHPTCTKRSLHVILRPVVVIEVAIARHKREEPQLKATVCARDVVFVDLHRRRRARAEDSTQRTRCR